MAFVIVRHVLGLLGLASKPDARRPKQRVTSRETVRIDLGERP